MDGSVLSVSGKLHSLLNGRQKYSLPVLYEINFKEMTYTGASAPYTQRPEAEDKLYQIEVFRDDAVE